MQIRIPHLASVWEEEKIQYLKFTNSQGAKAVEKHDRVRK